MLELVEHAFVMEPNEKLQAIAMENGWHPRTRFVEVVLNGEYRGVYLFTEKIKIFSIKKH